MIPGAYPPVNTNAANIRVSDGLAASTDERACPECGRLMDHKRLGREDICPRCRNPGQGRRERINRIRQAAYLAALSVWEGEGGALPPINPRLTLKQRGLKRCTACGSELPLGWFRRNGKGYRGRCRHCERPQKSRDSALRRLRIRDHAESLPPNTVQLLLERQRGLCACGCERNVRWHHHIDHRVPLARGGKHELANLQLLSPLCNLRKGSRL